jgi:hypothetical protein
MKGAIEMPKISRIIILASILGFSTQCLAGDAAAPDTSKKNNDAAVIKVNPASKARIEFLADTWDFGSIPRGAIVLHAFKFRNIGQDSLMITNVKPTCGCTTAPLSDSTVAPGETADIMATFNTKNFNGRVTKQIFVDSSDPIKPYLKLIFSAIINNPLQTILPTPAEADFGNVKVGTAAQVKITITNSDKTKADLTIVEESAASMVKAKLIKTTLAPEEATELVLDLAPQTKAGEINQSITLEARQLPGSRFTIPWKAVITK